MQVDPTQLCAEQDEKDQTPKQKRRLDFVRWVAAYQAMMLAADAAEVCEILCCIMHACLRFCIAFRFGPWPVHGRTFAFALR